MASSRPRNDRRLIVRIETPPARWRVQVVRSGRVYTKDFTDVAHGGRRAAFMKAVALRNRLLRRLPVRSAIKRYSSRSKTGVVGVWIRPGRGSRGTRARAYCASWVKAGRRYIRSFPVANYGEAQARARAIEARRRAVREIQRWRGRSPLSPTRRGNVGIVGIHLVQSRTPKGTQIRYYSATWVDAGGRDRQRTFSIRKHGHDRALALAIKARRQGLRDRSRRS